MHRPKSEVQNVEVAYAHEGQSPAHRELPTTATTTTYSTGTGKQRFHGLIY